MDVEEFNQATLGQLAAISGIDRHRWSRYLNGRVGISEKTLQRISQKFGMTSSQLLSVINDRRLSRKILS